MNTLIKQFIVTTLTALGILISGASFAIEKTPICHHSEEDGTWKLISIPENAVARHIQNHDDGLPGESSSQTNTALQNDCAVTQCSGTTAPGLTGCWFLGEFGESCDDVCSNVGLSYDEATNTVAGYAGSDDNCNAVLDALGVQAGNFDALLDSDALGCVAPDPDDPGASGLERARFAGAPTTSSATDAALYYRVQRVCACH